MVLPLAGLDVRRFGWWGRPVATSCEIGMCCGTVRLKSQIIDFAPRLGSTSMSARARRVTLVDRPDRSRSAIAIVTVPFRLRNPILYERLVQSVQARIRIDALEDLEHIVRQGRYFEDPCIVLHVSQPARARASK